MLISSWLKSFRTLLQTPPHARSLRRRTSAKHQGPSQRAEDLEVRSLLTSPELVAISPNFGSFVTDGTVLTDSPQELKFQFTPGQELDALSLSAIQIVGSGFDGSFGEGNERPITPGYRALGDTTDEVIFRFSQPLQDDLYQITISGTGANPLQDIDGDLFHQGQDLSLEFDLDVGAQIRAVVPQPVLRAQQISVTDVSALSDGDQITINDGSSQVVFEFEDTAVGDGTSGNTPISFSAGDATNTVAASIATAISNALFSGPGVSALASSNTVAVTGAVFSPTVSLSIANVSGISAEAGSVQQLGDTIVVYFNQDVLNPTDAEDARFYRLLDTKGSLDQTDDATLLPTSVTYDATAHYAVLKFASIPTGTYTLNIGSTGDVGDTAATAFDVGSLTSSSAFLNAGLIGDNNGPADIDLYRFVLPPVPPASGTATITMEVIPEAGSGLDSVIRIFNGSGHELDILNSTGSDGTETLTYAPSGLVGGEVFFVGISSAGNETYTTDGTGRLDGNSTGSYRLSIDAQAVGGFGSLSDDNSSFDTATELGSLGAQGQTISAQIEAQAIALPLYPGGSDEPGHRQIPAESHGVGAGAGVAVPNAITVRNYHFPDQYVNGNSDLLFNEITENQKQRTREIFELYASLYGIQFQESASNTGISIVTGRPGGTIPPGVSVGGPGGIIMNGSVDWGVSEFGGGWYHTALHELGHAIGLTHSYELPSVQGGAGASEDEYPGHHDIVHGLREHRPDATDIDLYKFEVAEPGTLTAEIVAERLSTSSLLDSALRLYKDVGGVRHLIAQNDDYFSDDAYIELFLEDAGTYYLGVSSTGNTNYDPTIADSGHGGVSDGAYDLRLNFASQVAPAMRDATGTVLDGDGDGTAGGDFVFSFRSNNTLFVDKSVVTNLTQPINATQTTIVVSDSSVFNAAVPFDVTIGSEIVTVTAINAGTNTLTVTRGAAGSTSAAHATKSALAPATADGSIANPFGLISQAVSSATAGDIIRILANGGTDNNVATTADNRPYLIGLDDANNELEDGIGIQVPQGVLLQVDAGAVLKLQGAIIDAGTSAQGVDRSGAAIQVLGTPFQQTIFTAYGNDAIGGDSDGVTDGANPGDWGGITFRQDSDFIATDALTNSTDTPITLNYVNQADISFGGGLVSIGATDHVFTPIHLETSRPTITNNTITRSATGAISADPDSFNDSRGRIGPEIHGNTVTQNTTNGLVVRFDDSTGASGARLNTSARFDDTDITHIITNNLEIAGNPGGQINPDNPNQILPGARLAIDPGIVIKLSSARIEMERGNSNLIAEGTPENPVIFTSLLDDRYGAGGTFDTTNNLDTVAPSGGDWSGLIFNMVSSGSIDNAIIAYGGGQSPIAGGLSEFNAVEAHHGATLRVANSVLEHNANGNANDDRDNRGTNTAATIFVRQSQPIIVNNVFVDNAGATLSINANAMVSTTMRDSGRSTGPLSVGAPGGRPTLNPGIEFADNNGPLVRLNRIDNNVEIAATNGMIVRGGSVTTESIWDDTDIVHVVLNEITVDHHHTFSGLRLQSNPSESLVVKLLGNNAGFTADGVPLDIDDRIGGTVQIIGRPDFPVVLTSLRDDTVGAGVTSAGIPNTDTNNDGDSIGEVNPNLLPTGPEVDNGTLIDNDVNPIETPGYFSLQLGDGGNSSFGGGGVTAQGNTQLFTNTNFVFAFINYIDVGSDGGGINLASTTITMPATLVSDDLVASEGTFAGDNGTVSWRAESSFEDGVATASNRIILSSPQPLGNIRFVNYLDEDVLGISDDLLYLDGTPGSEDFRAFTLDNAERIGFSQGGAYTAGTDLVNATYDGFAADRWSALQQDITGGGTSYTVAGNINTGNLPLIADPDLGDVYGLADITTAFAWTVDPNATTATITSFLELVAQDPITVVEASGDWRSLEFNEHANDRNVRTVLETEDANNDGFELNNTTSKAQLLGELARDLKSGDDNRALGFEVQGFISADDSSDVDIYSFQTDAGTDVWIDIDRTRGAALDLEIELIQQDGTVIASSTGANDAGDLGGAAAPLQQHAYNGGDFYTTNYQDPGMRVTLPGTSGGENETYYVRVRSANGLTNGEYQLQVRLRQADEKPGSIVQYADIRYATNGIEVNGLPSHSPLLAESGETSGDNNSPTESQDLGNLLQTDRNTISVGGALSSSTDTDFFRFNADYATTIYGPSIQAIEGRNAGTKTWSTVFDLDYADGLTRADASLIVWEVDEATGQAVPVLIGRESSIEDDQPGAGQGLNLDDLTRGSAGQLDPFIGPVQLPVGSPGSTTQYATSVNSNSQQLSQLNQTYFQDATNSLIRLEPVNSITRVVEDHIGFQGYASNGSTVLPTVDQGLFDISSTTSLAPTIRSLDLNDVGLYVSREDRLYTVRPLLGDIQADLGALSGDTDFQTRDIVMRSDGTLWAYQRINGFTETGDTDNNTAGRLVQIDPETIAVTVIGNDNILGQTPTVDVTNPDSTNPAFEEITFTDDVDALAWERSGGVGEDAQYALYYAVREQGVDTAGNDTFNSKLYRADPTSGSAAKDTDSGFGLHGDLQPTGVDFADMLLVVANDAGDPIHDPVMLQARAAGVAGNGITVQITASGDLAVPVIVTATGATITLQFDDGFGASAQDVIDAINQHEVARTLVTAGLTPLTRGPNVQVPVTLPNTPAFPTSDVLNGGSDGTGYGPLQGHVTGLAFANFHGDLDILGDVAPLYGVTSAGEFIQIRTGANNSGRVTNVVDLSTLSGVTGFQGLALGPQNLQGGVFRNTLFAITTDGKLMAIDPSAFNIPSFTANDFTVNAFGSDNESQTITRAGTYNAGDTFTLTFDNGLFAPATTAPIAANASAAEIQAALEALTSNGQVLLAGGDVMVTEAVPGTEWAVEFGGFYTDKSVNALVVNDAGVTAGSVAVVTTAEGGDGIGTTFLQQTQADTGLGGAVTGLAFSPIDFNLWHPTTNRGTAEFGSTNDAGHGINAAFDNSRVPSDANANHVDPQGHLYELTQAHGGVSLYFGLEEYVDNDLNEQPYLNYEATQTQLGIHSNEFHRDLTSSAVVGNNYNVPGGAAGALVTRPFNLVSDVTGDADSGDRPTLYFNYYLDTEDQNTDREDGFMRDSARVYISADGGRSWELLVTNNTPAADDGVIENINTTRPEVPDFISHHSEAGGGTGDAEQRIQPLFDDQDETDTTVWRQARVDLGDYAGQTGLQLRFDFSTSGTLVSDRLLSNDNDLRTSQDGYGDGDRDDDRRGVDNDHEGFYIDDIIIGWSERGEMITAATNDSDFFTVPQNPADNAPLESLTGTYQVEIRRGHEYATIIDDVEPEIRVYQTHDTNSRFVSGANVSTGEVRGDRNIEREQGVLIIEGNTIRDVTANGITINAGSRDAGTNNATPGSPILFETLNANRLTPGVSVSNNVVARFGSAGIHFAGESNVADDVPPAAVPYGKIVNNTIYGGMDATPAGNSVGINVGSNAAPTLLNNLIVNTATGIQIASSSGQTVVARTYFRGNTTSLNANGTGVTSDLEIPDIATNLLFVNETTDNFYLAGDSNPLDLVFDGALAIDRSLKLIDERSDFTAVKSDLGIPDSAIVSPSFDIYGQKRVDDALQPPSGVGSEVFNDVGAIERADFIGPFATLQTPLDNGVADLQPVNHDVFRIEANFLSELIVKLNDTGSGIDDQTVTTTQWELKKDGQILTDGIDYQFVYIGALDQVIFQSLSSFETDSHYTITVLDQNPATTVRDRAANPIQANRSNGEIRFEIILDNGVNDAPVNSVPANVVALEDSTDVNNVTTPLIFNDTNGNAITVSDADTYLGTNELTVTLIAEQGSLLLPAAMTTNVAGDSITFPDGAAVLNEQFTITDSRDANNIQSQVFTFVDATVVLTPTSTQIALNPAAMPTAENVATAAATAINTFFGATTATPSVGTIGLATSFTAGRLLIANSSIDISGSNSMAVQDGATVIGESVTVGIVTFTYVDAAIWNSGTPATTPAVNQIAVEKSDTAATVAAATAAAISHSDLYGMSGLGGTANAASSSGSVVTLDDAALYFSNTDGTSIVVDGLEITLPDAATAITEELVVNGTTYRFINAADTPAANEITVTITGTANDVAAALLARLNSDLGIGQAGRSGTKVTLISGSGHTASIARPLILSGSVLTTPVASTAIGDHIGVGRTAFTYVSSAVVTMPSANEIALDPADNADTVAAKTAAALNAHFGAGTASASADEVTLTGVVVAGVTPDSGMSVVTLTGDVTQLNQALNGLQFTPNADYFGPAAITVLTEDLGQYTQSVATLINMIDIDTISIDVTPINDMPTAGNVTEQMIVEDQDLVAPFGTVDTHVINLTNIDAGPINELEDITISAQLADIVNVAVTNGAQAIGGNLTVDGVEYTFVDSATTPTPLATDIPVSASASTTDVAAAAAARINAHRGAAVDIAEANFNFVSFRIAAAQVTSTSGNFHISDQNALIASMNLNYSAGSTTGTVDYTPVANAFGLAEVVLTITDAGVDNIPGNTDDVSVEQTIKIIVEPVGDAPALDAVADDSADEYPTGTGELVALTGINVGPTNELEDYRVSAALTDTTIVAFATANNVDGESLVINGTAFTFATVATGAANEIVVAAGDSTLDIATKAAAVINASLPAATPIAVAHQNSVALRTNITNVDGGGATDAFSIIDQNQLITNLTVNFTSGAATADITYAPGAELFGGPVEVTVTVEDAGVDGLFDNADDLSVTRTFNITINPINDGPTLGAITDIALNEFSPGVEQLVPLSGIDVGPSSELEDYRLTAALTDTTIVAFAVGADVDGHSLTINGTTFTFATIPTGAINEIVVTATDSTLDVASKAAVVINATFPAATPFATAHQNSVALRTAIANVSDGGATNAFTLISADQLITNISVDSTSPATTSTLRFTPGSDQFGGPVEVTVTMQDGGVDGLFDTADDLSTSQTFTILISPTNDTPTLDNIGNVTISEQNVPAEQTIGLTGIGSGQTNELENLSVTANMAATTSIAIGGAAGLDQQTITVGGTAFTYVNTPTGAANEIHVVNGESSNAVAIATANAINSAFPAQTTTVSGNTATTELSVDAGTSGLIFATTSANIISGLAVDYSSPDPTATLRYTPVANAFGQVNITVTVTDAGIDGISGNADDLTTSESFTIAVSPVNDGSILNNIPAQSVTEDDSEQNVSLTGIAAGPINELESVRFDVALQSSTSLAVSTGANVLGKTITVNGQTFTYVSVSTAAREIVVQSAHDTHQVAAATAAAINTEFGAGAATATNNTVTTAMSVATTATDDFAVLDAADIIGGLAIDYTTGATTGTLRYTPVSQGYGQVTVHVTTTDAGIDGIFDTADDLSVVQQPFTITVAPVNDAPAIGLIPDQSTTEDATEQSITLSGIANGQPGVVDNEVDDVLVTAQLQNTTSVLVTAGHNVLGRTLTVNATVFRYVETAVDANDIAVTATTTSADVATATANVINSVMGAGTAVASNSAVTSSQTMTPNSTTAFAVLNSAQIVDGLAVDHSSRDAGGTLRYTPVAGAHGHVFVTVTVADAGVDGIFGTSDDLTTTDDFAITVNPVNDQPTLTPVDDLTTQESAVAQTVNLTGITTGHVNDLEDLNVTAQLLNTTSVAFTMGGQIDGETLTIGAETFTFRNTATGAVNEIVVGATDATQSVAAAAAAAINSRMGLGTVTTVDNTVTTTTALSITASSTEAFAVMSSASIISGLSVDYTSGDTTATLHYAPDAENFGQVTVRVTTTDAGLDGIAGNADDLNISDDFVITVTPTNDVPTLDQIANQQTSEDATEQSVNLTGISAGPVNELENTQVTAILEATVSVGVANGDRVIGQTLTVDGTVFTFVNSAVVGTPGTHDIAVETTDSTTNIATKAAAAINAANGNNAVTAAGNTINTALTVTGSSTTVFQILNSSDIISGLAVDYVSRDTTGTLRYQPIANAFGLATVTVTVQDAGIDGLMGNADDRSVSRTFNINVAATNDQPTIDAGIPQETAEDSSQQTVNLTGITTGNPLETEDLRVTAAVADSNTLIVGSGEHVVGHIVTFGGVDFTYVTTSTGTTTDIVVAATGTLVTIDSTFDVATATADALNAHFGAGTALAVGNTVNTTLSVTTSSQDAFAIAHASDIVTSVTSTYTSANDVGTLNYTPVPDAFGRAVVVVTVQDAGVDGLFDTADDQSVSTEVPIIVNAVNDAPALANIADVLTRVNNPEQTVDLTGIRRGPANEIHDLRITAVSSDPSIIPNPGITYTNPDDFGSLLFTPVAGQSGAATITVTVEDAGIDGIFGDPVTAISEQADNLTITRTFRIATPPILLSPTGVVTDTTPSFSWTSIPGTAAYDIRLFNVTDDLPVNIGPAQTSATVLELTQALPLGEYQFDVRAVDALGNPGYWSDSSSFTVSIPPTVSSPSEDRLNDSTPSFVWSAVDGADNYTLTIVNDFTGNTVFTQTGLTSTQFTLPDTASLPLGRYRYTVAANNLPAANSSGGIVSASTEHTITISTPPEILLPFVAIYDSTPTITWTQPLGTVVSDVDIFNAVTEQRVSYEPKVVGTEFTTGNLRAGEYRVRVRSYGDEARTIQSDWSTPHIFQVGTAPVLFGPSDSEGGTNLRQTTDQRPTLTWQESLDGETYQIWVSDLTSGEPIYVVDDLETASFTPTEDLPVGQYRYWVRARTGTGERSAWSRAVDFQVVTPPKVTPIGTSTLNRTPTITWENQANVDTWQIWINDIDQTPAVIVHNVTDLTSPEFTIPEDLANGRYKVWVRGFASSVNPAIGMVATEWSDDMSFEVGGRPVVTNPESTQDTTPTLTWSHVDGAASYEIHFSSASAVHTAIARESGITGTSYTITEELAPGSYRFWVRAVTPDGARSQWSLNSQSYIGVQTVTRPVLNPVADGSDTTPRITWQPANNAVRYEIYISLRSSSGTAVIRQNDITDTSFIPATPLAANSYRVWVRAIGASNELSSWSTPVEFTITVSDFDNTAEQPLSILTSIQDATTELTANVATDVTRSATAHSEVVDESFDSGWQVAAMELVAPAKPTVAPTAAAAETNTVDEEHSDNLMSVWDDVVRAEEAAVTGSESETKEASSWLLGLAALAPAVLKRRRKED